MSYSNLQTQPSDFSGSGGLTWTNVPVLTLRAIYDGTKKLLRVSFVLGPAIVGGAPDIDLKLRIPDGYMAKAHEEGTFAYINNGATGIGKVRVLEGSAFLEFRKAPGVPWALASDTWIEGTFTFEVQ
jgi:hypothetical protein